MKNIFSKNLSGKNLFQRGMDMKNSVLLILAFVFFLLMTSCSVSPNAGGDSGGDTGGENSSLALNNIDGNGLQACYKPGTGNGGTSSASSLGTASSFVILGGPAVTLTRSPVTGNVGTGFPGAPVTQTLSPVTGTVHEGDVISIAAYNDFLLAYTALGATPNPTDPTHLLTGTLAGVTLLPGVYYFDAAAALTGVLTLDANGNPNATWIFKIGTSGTGALTGTDFSVVMTNGGIPCNVYWWAAEAATMTSSNFVGNILAGAAITFTGGNFTGRALAKAAVTLTDMTSFIGCSTVTPGGGGCGDKDKDHKKHKDHNKNNKHR